MGVIDTFLVYALNQPRVGGGTRPSNYAELATNGILHNCLPNLVFREFKSASSQGERASATGHSHVLIELKARLGLLIQLTT